MKMKLLSFAAAFLLTATAYSQHVRVEGGINLANVSVTDNGRVNNANMLTSFQVGIIGDARLADFLYFEPGLVYTGKGSKVQSGNPSDLNYYKATSNPFYIEMPLNFVLKTPSVKGTRFFAGAGPYLAVGVNGKNSLEGKYAGLPFSSDNNIRFSNDDPTTLSYEEGAGFGIMKRFDYGLNGLAGIEGKSLVLSANYGLGLAKLQSGSNSSANDNNKHRVLSFTLGFKL